MNGVSASGTGRGLPATAVFCLSPRLLVPIERTATRGSETLLAAIACPPRAGEPRLLGALVPEVLARYGLAAEPNGASSVDLLA